MKTIFGNVAKRVAKVSSLSREELAYRVLPNFLLDLVERYFRVRTVGAHHIPEKGPCIVIANHSGYMALDALMIAHEIQQKKQRLARTVAHKLWFIRPEISVHAKKMGLVPAKFSNALKIVKQGEVLLLFPEGEEGNFKPTSKRYWLRRFRRGFVRLALETGAPIVPAMVIGAEESNITLSQIRWAKHIVGTIVPVPLITVPLPSKWHIRFLPPIKLEKNPEKAKDEAYVNKVSRHIRKELQEAIHLQLKRRKSIF